MADPRTIHRVTYQPPDTDLKPIPWPDKLAPELVHSDGKDGAALTSADVLVVTWTAAEWRALASVLSPGRDVWQWEPYTHNWDAFEPHLTDQSPARDARCLGEYTYVTVGEKTVCLFHSQLHMDTDDATVPLIALWRQIIGEAEPKFVIDTGTAGGIGPTVVEGDAVVGQNLVFDCTGFLKDKPWAHQAFPCTLDTSHIDFTEAEFLMTANADLLRPEASRDPKVFLADVITCDSFLFDAVGDPYGLETYDEGKALVEEMDAATLALACEDITAAGGVAPLFTSVRSVSDPQIPNLGSVEAEKREASTIYDRYGFAAQASTLCAVWQVIVSSG